MDYVVVDEGGGVETLVKGRSRGMRCNYSECEHDLSVMGETIERRDACGSFMRE